MADDDTKFTVWVTKYALSDGIEQVVVVRTALPTLVRRADAWHVLFSAKHWHRTREAAVARAEEMRIAKIASLEKQLARLRKLRFEAGA